MRWLLSAIKGYSGSLIVVTHDRQLLRLFDAFFVVAEGGCHLVTGGFDVLVTTLDAEQKDASRRYLAELARLPNGP